MKGLLFVRVFRLRYSLLQCRSLSDVPVISQPLFRNFDLYSNNDAVVDNVANYKYRDILRHSRQLAQKMRESSPTLLQGERKTVSFLCANDATYVVTLLACWFNGNIAVPLCKEHPPSLHEYFMNDSKSELVVCTSPFMDQIQPLAQKLNIPLLQTAHPHNERIDSNSAVPNSVNEQNQQDHRHGTNGAVIIYTSGTTGPPKGVLLTHNNLHVQVSDIVKSWNFSSKDVMLNVLPLHHVHGFLYCLLSPLAVGGTVVMMPKFDAIEVWKHFIHVNDTQAKINTFSAVPTIYTKLIHKFDEFCKLCSLDQSEVKKRCTNNMRFMGSGSSALPDPVFTKWEELTGHIILERYGSSEIGMALSNPLDGKRIAGSVGQPLPAVQARIVKSLSPEGKYEIIVESTSGKTTVSKGTENEPGDLHIKGPNVFAEYWLKPEATEKSFTKDGWFETGDVAVYENGVYRILGRASSDIIKTGGYKVSALDVERYLLEHSAVAECTVFGLPDDEWGEIIIAVLMFHTGKETSALSLKEFCKTRLPPYSIPKIFKVVDNIPRNVTGKVNKKELRELFSTELKEMLKK